MVWMGNSREKEKCIRKSGRQYLKFSSSLTRRKTTRIQTNFNKHFNSIFFLQFHNIWYSSSNILWLTWKSSFRIYFPISPYDFPNLGLIMQQKLSGMNTLHTFRRSHEVKRHSSASGWYAASGSFLLSPCHIATGNSACRRQMRKCLRRISSDIATGAALGCLSLRWNIHCRRGSSWEKYPLNHSYANSKAIRRKPFAFYMLNHSKIQRRREYHH